MSDLRLPVSEYQSLPVANIHNSFSLNRTTPVDWFSFGSQANSAFEIADDYVIMNYRGGPKSGRPEFSDLAAFVPFNVKKWRVTVDLSLNLAVLQKTAEIEAYTTGGYSYRISDDGESESFPTALSDTWRRPGSARLSASLVATTGTDTQTTVGVGIRIGNQLLLYRNRNAPENERLIYLPNIEVTVTANRETTKDQAEFETEQTDWENLYLVQDPGPPITLTNEVKSGAPLPPVPFEMLQHHVVEASPFVYPGLIPNQPSDQPGYDRTDYLDYKEEAIYVELWGSPPTHEMTTAESKITVLGQNLAAIEYYKSIGLGNFSVEISAAETFGPGEW